MGAVNCASRSPARHDAGNDPGALTGNEAGAHNAATAALALVERYHAFSAHSRAGLLLRAPSVDWGDPPPAFKQIRSAQRVPLPAPAAAPGARFDLATLAKLLWHTAGVTATRAQISLRASPSSGALFSTELYVAAQDVAGLSPGLWHYDARTHALARLDVALADRAPADVALGAPGNTVVRDAAASVIATAVFRRTGHKYRDRTYRYVLADLGHALENLRVAAGAAGAAAHFVAASTRRESRRRWASTSAKKACSRSSRFRRRPRSSACDTFRPTLGRRTTAVATWPPRRRRAARRHRRGARSRVAARGAGAAASVQVNPGERAGRLPRCPLRSRCLPPRRRRTTCLR